MSQLFMKSSCTKFHVLTMLRVVALVVGLCFVLLFLFVPETFWDRAPRPKSRSQSGRTSGVLSRMMSSISHRVAHLEKQGDAAGDETGGLHPQTTTAKTSGSAAVGEMARRRSSTSRPTRALHVGFAPDDDQSQSDETVVAIPTGAEESRERLGSHQFEALVQPRGGAPPTPALHNLNSPFYTGLERSDSDYMNLGRSPIAKPADAVLGKETPSGAEFLDEERFSTTANASNAHIDTQILEYTHYLRGAPPRSFIQQLAPWNGRLTHDSWLRVAARPFFLFTYPAVLWSAIVYSCSIGWLIVLSESVSTIYRSPTTYNFSALSTGLIYLSPFIGGVLGTAVAGKVSDIIVRAMSKRNGGLYEPEFRLIMAIPVAFSTVIGLMGFGWSAEEKDAWIVPTLFFGVISFGCSLGSTTAITFCVDSYRQYAGEALVTLNFSKNIFHGLVFSLFFNNWLDKDGSKKVFIALGGIQLGLMLLTIPMYIYGKRARMWTVRKNFVERF